MEKEIETIKGKSGCYIPKHFRDFKKLVADDVSLSEYISMNYEEMDSEDLGANLEKISQGFAWIMELIENRELVYKPSKGGKHGANQKKHTI